MDLLFELCSEPNAEKAANTRAKIEQLTSKILKLGKNIREERNDRVV
jgi:hypothetical protein